MARTDQEQEQPAVVRKPYMAGGGGWIVWNSAVMGKCSGGWELAR